MSDGSRIRTCRDCGEEWEFTEKEEAFLRGTFGDEYNEPTRCLPCRKLNKEKKAAKAGQGAQPGRFDSSQPNPANQPKRQRSSR